MAEVMDVRLVSLELWEKYEREVLKQEGFTASQVANIEREEQKVERVQDSKILAAIQARQMVTEFHNRHIGLTCRLAYRLARVLLRPLHMSEAAKPWGEVLARLNKELSPKDSIQIGVSQLVHPVGGVLLKEAPIYTAHRLVMPLVQIACYELGECYLATLNVASSPLSTVQDLLTYDEAMVRKIAELAENIANTKLSLFWIDRAFTLATYSKRTNLQQSLPDPDALSAALFYRLDTLPENLREYETLQRMPARFRQQRVRRMREEGLSGIVISRSLEDVNRMLLSELMYPPLLRADRLLNSGYLVTERFSRQEKLRDALIVGFLPPNTGELANRAFVKTCWFNTMMVLAQILFRNRLFDSEFWWVEGDVLERYSTAVFPLSHLRLTLKTRNQIQVLGHTNFRSMFLNLTSWQPGFLDPDKLWHILPAEEMLQPVERDTGLSSAASLPARWILSTARTQRLVVPPSREGLRTIKTISSLSPSTLVEMAEGFSMVHFMTFLPAELLALEEDDPWGQKIEARLMFGLRLANIPLHNLSITWLAEAGQSQRRQPPPVLRYLGRFFRQKYSWDAAVPEGDLRALSSKLEKTWLDEMVRELQIEI